MYLDPEQIRDSFRQAETLSKIRKAQLDDLSAQLQSAGIHELARLVRQSVVSHRNNSYCHADRQFIEKILNHLVPEGEFTETLARIGDQLRPFMIHNMTHKD